CLVAARRLDGRGLCGALELAELAAGVPLAALELEELGAQAGPGGLGTFDGRAGLSIGHPGRCQLRIEGHPVLVEPRERLPASQERGPELGSACLTPRALAATARDRRLDPLRLF